MVAFSTQELMITPSDVTVGTVEQTSIRVGTDLQAVAEVAGSITAFGDRYLRRVFGDDEVADSGGPDGVAGLAARYAAKEAFFKVLRPVDLVPPWTSVRIVRHTEGWTDLQLSGAAEEMAAAQGLGQFAVSLSHSGEYAMATVVAVSTCLASTVLLHVDRQQKGGPSMDELIRRVLAEHGRMKTDVMTVERSADLFRAGLTSHASVNVMLALEDAFDVEFPDALLRKSTFESVDAIRAALVGLGAAVPTA